MSISDDSEDSSEDDANETSPGMNKSQTPPRMDARKTSTSKRRRDPLEDVTNDSPRQNTKAKRAKTHHRDAGHAGDENRSQRTSTPQTENNEGDEPERKAKDDSYRASPTPSTESTTSSALETGQSKSRSSGLDTQGRVDAQLFADAQAYERNYGLDTITEEDLYVGNPRSRKSHSPENLNDMEAPRDNGASVSQHDDSHDVFETAPADPPPDPEDESVTTDETAPPSNLDEPGSPRSRPATAESTPRPPRRAPPVALVPASSPSSQQPSPLKSTSRAMPPPPHPSSRTTLPASPLPASRPPAPPESPDDSSVKAWARTSIGPATPLPVVCDALRATSMNLDVADALLARVRRGELAPARAGGPAWLPDDMPGVWTARDDALLHGVNDAQARKARAVEKHGRECVEARLTFWRVGGADV